MKPGFGSRPLYYCLVQGFGDRPWRSGFGKRPGTRLGLPTLEMRLWSRTVLLWCKVLVPTLNTFCLKWMSFFILDVAAVMPAGCPRRKTHGIWLWPCGKYETLQPGRNNLAWADPSTVPSEIPTLCVCPVLRPHLLSITSRTWRFPLLCSREDRIHWQTPKTLQSSWLRWVPSHQVVEVWCQY